MLSKFAIIPGAFDVVQATSPNALDAGIGCLNDLCRAEGLFLDLRDGQWASALDKLDGRSKAFLKFAKSRNRLVPARAELKVQPDEDDEWLWEAQAVHKRAPCRAIVTPEAIAAGYEGDPDITSIERINSTAWWEERSSSLDINRNTKVYRATLDPLLRHANLLMFIDAYIDPLAENYSQFPELLSGAGGEDRQPVIQIHRASWRKVNGKNVVQSLAGWMKDFEGWSQLLEGGGLRAEVFLWADIHDRFLISDIIGVNLPYGFDIGGGAPTTWTRIGRRDQERLQREYEANCKLHGFVGGFHIGKAQVD